MVISKGKRSLVKYFLASIPHQTKITTYNFLSIYYDYAATVRVPNGGMPRSFMATTMLTWRELEPRVVGK